MKKIFLILLLASLAFGLNAQSLGYTKTIFTLTGYTQNAVLNFHAPISNEYQTTTQLTNHGTFREDGGTVVRLSGNFTYSAMVEVQTPNILINSDPRLPITTSGFSNFLQESEKIQNNNAEISAKAREITAGAETELEAAQKILKWAQANIKYDAKLNLTEVPDSLTVLRTLRGVCTGYSVLSAAFLRSTGIPTKYVRGYLYTGTEFQAHAWLEIYVPDTGWIPFDATVGEMGQISAGHIKLMDGADPSTTADTISFTPPYSYDKNAALELKEYREFPNIITASANTDPSKVGFGSFTAMNLLVSNSRDSYVVSFVKVSHSAELTMDKTYDVLVLKPRETKRTSFDVFVPQGLEKDKIYTFQFLVYGTGFQTNTSLVSQEDAPIVTKEKIALYSFSKYAREDIIIFNVKIRNVGNKDVSNIEVALENSALGKQTRTTTLAAGENTSFDFEFTPPADNAEYEFTLSVKTNETAITQQAIVEVPKKSTPAEPPELMENAKTFIVVAAIILAIVVGLIFISPLFSRPKTPFGTKIHALPKLPGKVFEHAPQKKPPAPVTRATSAAKPEKTRKPARAKRQRRSTTKTQ